MGYCLFGEINRIDMECNKILRDKNESYGNSYKTDGFVGLVLRMGDKLMRLKHLEKNKLEIVVNESIRDTLLDLRNYTTLALIELDNMENGGN